MPLKKSELDFTLDKACSKRTPTRRYSFLYFESDSRYVFLIMSAVCNSATGGAKTVKIAIVDDQNAHDGSVIW